MSLASRQVHLDFHTGKLPYTVGKEFNKSNFQETLQSSHINSITLTGRDHHGWVYYQSQDFIKHPQLGKRDFLKEQIDACHEVGIKAPIYLTAGWDAHSASKHPEWLERQIDGKTYGFEDHNQLEPGWKTLCFNTTYVEYLIAQTKDLLQHFNYKIDGLFYDILWQDQCFCDQCIEKMQKQKLNPESEKDRKNFATETEQRFKDRIVEAVHSVAPECPVVFNEGNITPIIRPNLADYNHLEIESLPGGKWGYQHFPVTVRYAKNLGKEYMGMTGRFHLSWGDFGSYRDEPALEYENFLALIHGAKCSIGDQMYPDGTLSKKAYETIGKVYSKIEMYEKYEQNVEPVCNIGILHPGIIEEGDEQVDIALAGAVNMLNELHLEFAIIDDLMDWNKYELIVLPDKIMLNPRLEKKINEYLKAGGKVIATYQSGLNFETRQFPNNWGLHYEGINDFTPTYFKFTNEKTDFVLHGKGLKVSSKKSANLQVIAEQWLPLYQRNYQHFFGHYQAPIGEKDKKHPAAVGSEQLVYFNYPLFTMYKEQGSTSYKQLLKSGIEYLLKEPGLIKYSNFPTSGDAVLNHQPSQRRLVLGLLNYIPERRSLQGDTIQDVTPLPGVKISINWSKIQQKLGIDGELQSIYSAVSQKNLTRNDKDKFVDAALPIIKGYEFIILNY